VTSTVEIEEGGGQVPDDVRARYDAWTERAGIASGRVFRSLRKGDGAALGAGLSTQAIADVVTAHAEPLASTSRRTTAGCRNSAAERHRLYGGESSHWRRSACGNAQAVVARRPGNLDRSREATVWLVKCCLM
jgi:hypothetical protein